jgi:predicted alpha/beta superfamily hydrolase
LSHRLPSAARCRLIAAFVAAATALLVAAAALAVPVTFRVIAPVSTPAGAPIHVAGNFQGWDAGSPACRLTDRGGRLYEITFEMAPGSVLEFKFTRGDWGKVEKGMAGEELANRTWTVTGPVTLQRTVARWADLAPGTTRAGNLTTLTVPGFLGGRRVWVYLPPGYATETSRRYPVLYLLDGQNVFDLGTSFAGEWMVDEACEALIPAGLMAPVIVVAVDNGGASRLTEYTPWYDAGYGAGGGADAHLQAIAGVLMPWVNANYRTLTGPANTVLAGSSLGGLLADYAVYARADVFGRAAGLSPSIWWNGNELLDYVAARPKPAAKVYTDMGTLEAGSFQDADGNGVDDTIDDLRALEAMMVGQGFTAGSDLLVVEDPGARHNEWCWAQRFPVALCFLFPPAVSAAPEVPAIPFAMARLTAWPNPFNPRVTLAFELPAANAAEVRVYSVRGELVAVVGADAYAAGHHQVVWDGRGRDGREAPSGTYRARLFVGGRALGEAVGLGLVR